MEILKDNEIRRYSQQTTSKLIDTKSVLIDFIIKRGWTPTKYGINKKEKATRVIDPKYNVPRQTLSKSKEG